MFSFSVAEGGKGKKGEKKKKRRGEREKKRKNCVFFPKE